MKNRKPKFGIKLITTCAIAICSVTSVFDNSFAMMSQENEPQRVESKEVTEQSIKNTEKFLESLKKMLKDINLDIKHAVPIIIGRGGDHDLTDDPKRTFLYGYLNTNRGLDILGSYMLDLIISTLKQLNQIKQFEKGDYFPVPLLVEGIDLLTKNTYKLKDTELKILDSLKYEPDKSTGFNFGGKFYGSTSDYIAVKEFCKIALPEMGYKVKEEDGNMNIESEYKDKPKPIFLYNMINDWAEGTTATGFEVRYVPQNNTSRQLAEIIYKNCKDVITKRKTDRIDGFTEGNGRRTTNFAQQNDLNAVLSHIGFGNNPNEQKRILDPETMRKLAMQYVRSIFNFLNLHPIYACVTVETAPSYSEINPEFIVKAHFKNVNLNQIKNGLIKIGRNDLPKESWNEKKNNEKLEIKKLNDEKDITYELTRTFNPLTDGSKEECYKTIYDENERDFKGYNNKFYIEIFQNENRILADNTAFRLIKEKPTGVKVGYNDFTKYD